MVGVGQDERVLNLISDIRIHVRVVFIPATGMMRFYNCMSRMRPTPERLQSAIQSNEMSAMRHTGHEDQKVGIRPFKAVGAQEGLGGGQGRSHARSWL